MLRRFWAAVCAGLIMVGMLAQPAQAASPADRYQVQCQDGVCRFVLDLGLSGSEMLPQGIWLEVAEQAVQRLPGGSTLAVTSLPQAAPGDGAPDAPAALQLPTGMLELVDADLTLELDEAGRVVAMQGSAMLPVPTLGLLGDMEMVTPARVDLGYAAGAALAHLDAPLDAARRYLYFDAQAGLQLVLGTEPAASLTSPAGQRVTLIVDVLQPLIYVDGQMTLRTDGRLAFVREAMGPVGDGSWLPDELPLLQTSSLHLQAQAGRGVEPRLALDGSYRMESGLVGRWLRLDATPVVAQGQALLSPLGLLVAGDVRSTLAPEQFLAADSRVDFFFPFSLDNSLTAEWAVDVSMPRLQIEAQAAQQYSRELGRPVSMARSTWSGMQEGAGRVAAVARDGYAWLNEGTTAGMAYSLSVADRWRFAKGR